MHRLPFDPDLRRHVEREELKARLHVVAAYLFRAAAIGLALLALWTLSWIAAGVISEAALG